LTINRIIFWQPFASPHQEALLEAVAEQFPGEVILAVEGEMPEERVAQGWRKPQHKLVHVRPVSCPELHAALTQHSGPDSVHVFTGFFSHPLVWKAFRTLAPSQARLGIYSEAPEQPALTGWLKRLRGRWLAKRWAKRFTFVLAVGGVGREFFERIGFPKEKIVSYGYYLPSQPRPQDTQLPPTDTIRLVSAGQLIPRKGADLLIAACSSLPSSGWKLDIYGDGPERRRLEHLAARRGLANRVRFQGVVANSDLRAAIEAADWAVLPSRFDGWGVLANEALLSGTPVICSDACGASVAVSHLAAGLVVTAGRQDALEAALRQAVNDDRPSAERRATIRDRAALELAPRQAARRLLEAAIQTKQPHA